MDKKILIIGEGHSPTGRCLWLRDRLIGVGLDVEYRQLGAEIIGKQVHEALVDDHFGQYFADIEAKVTAHMQELFRFGTTDFDGIERRISNAIVYGTSHPEMLRGNPDDIHWPLPLKEPPPDQRKGPKGPRNRWGKL